MFKIIHLHLFSATRGLNEDKPGFGAPCIRIRDSIQAETFLTCHGVPFLSALRGPVGVKTIKSMKHSMFKGWRAAESFLPKNEAVVKSAGSPGLSWRDRRSGTCKAQKVSCHLSRLGRADPAQRSRRPGPFTTQSITNGSNVTVATISGKMRSTPD